MSTYCQIGGVTLRGEETGNENELFITEDGIEGWYATPDAKVTSTERQTGDGAHDIQDGLILYSARTVTVHFLARGSSRTNVIAQVNKLSALVHKTVKIRVVDAGQDTYCTGYVAPVPEAKWSEKGLEGTVTVVCVRPERLSTAAHTMVLTPTSNTTRGGLMFGPDGTGGLLLPIQFSKVASTLNNYGTVVNNGTSRAYPTIKVNGVFNGLSINIITPESGTSTITYSGYVGAVPLVLDFKSRTAYIDSLDTSKYLTSRGFQSVQPGSSMGVTLTTTGSGYITVSVNDTYL